MRETKGAVVHSAKMRTITHNLQGALRREFIKTCDEIFERGGNASLEPYCGLLYELIQRLGRRTIPTPDDLDQMARNYREDYNDLISAVHRLAEISGSTVEEVLKSDH